MAATIQETIGNALSQTWPNIEIIIVDDGSMDETLAIASGIGDDRVRVYTQVNAGASAARNRAMAESRGEYLQFLDADDLLGPDKIELQMRVLLENPGVVASCAWGRFHGSVENARFVRQASWSDFDKPHELLGVLYDNNFMMPSNCWLVPRAVCEKAGNWDERLSLDDDGEFFCRVVLASRSIRFVEGARTYYRSGIPGSLSRIRNRRAWQSQLLSIDLCASHLLEVDATPQTRLSLANRYQRFVYHCWPEMPELVEQASRRVRELGGSDLKPILGGRLANRMASVIGWKATKWLRIHARSLLRLEHA